MNTNRAHKPLVAEVKLDLADKLVEALWARMRATLSPEGFALVQAYDGIRAYKPRVAGTEKLGFYTPELAVRDFEETLSDALDALPEIEWPYEVYELYPERATDLEHQRGERLVRALDGEVIHDPDNTEVGTYELTLTAEGRADELFGGLPDRFLAQMGHKERAFRYPAGIPNLASSERSPLQALPVSYTHLTLPTN